MARGRGERAGLDAAEIVATARTILDEKGWTALSMRRVATALGVAPNALYAHVADKDALVDAVLDDLLGEIPTPAPQRTPRASLTEILVATRALLARHPAAVPAALARPGRGPNATRLGEAMLRDLARMGLEGPAATRALQVLLVHTLGWAAFEAPRLAEADPEARRRASEKAFRARGGRMAKEAASLAKHPSDEAFQWALQRLLDGIEAEGKRRRGGSGPLGAPFTP